MHRFSILNLMGLVLTVAIAIAALRNADDYWAGALLLATSLIIGIAVLGGILGMGRSRAGNLGFAVFAGGYFAMAFLGLSEANMTKLPTYWLLSYVNQRVLPVQPFRIMIAGTSGQAASGVAFTSFASPTANTFSVVNVASSTQVPPTASGLWKSLIPGAVNIEAFNVIGHCIFSLLSGLLGMIIARWIWARRVLAENGIVPNRKSGT
jgi:hypothetical protein